MMKSYLVTLTFVSGEYEQTFHKIFKAKTMCSVDKKIHKYLVTYYPDTKKEREDLYFYFGGEVAVKLENYEEITDPQQVVDRLTV